MISVVRGWVAAVAVVSVVTGCTATVSGTAVKAPGRPGVVDVALLDPGNYPTKPRNPLGNAGDDTTGAWAEARRMADNVVGPWEADPDLTEFVQFDTGVVKDSSTVDSVIHEPIGQGVDGHHFITGFTTARYTVKAIPYKGLTNAVLRFATPEDAAAAAADMNDKSAHLIEGRNLPPVPSQPFAIPRHPDVGARTYEWNYKEDYLSEQVEVRHAVIAIIAHGPYVLCQWAASVQSPDIAAQMIATILDLQQPLIDQFKPTPLDQLATLPLDPSGLVARTMPPSRTNETINDGVYNARGAVHMQTMNPTRTQALFKSAGLQQSSYTVLINVYQLPDADAAARIAAELASSAVDSKMLKSGGVKGMPDAKCFRTPKDPKQFQAFYCVAVADRYAFGVQDEHEAAAHQLIAAQYLMLTGK